MNYYDHISNMVTLTRVESQKSLSINDGLDIHKNLHRHKNVSPKNLKLLASQKLSVSEMSLVPQRRKSSPNGFDKLSSRTSWISGGLLSDKQKSSKKYGSQKNLASSESNLSQVDETVVERSPRKLWSTSGQKRPVSSIELSYNVSDDPSAKSASKRSSLTEKLSTPKVSQKKLSIDIKAANQKRLSIEKLDVTPKTPKTPGDAKLNGSKSAQKRQSITSDKLSLPNTPRTPKTPTTPDTKLNDKLASQHKLSKLLTEKLDVSETDDKLSVVNEDLGENNNNNKLKVPIIVTTVPDEFEVVDYATDEEIDGNLKPQSSPRLSASPSSAGSGKTGGSSKARQKKFHRHFQQVAEEERVINYYSCALVSDILLQGHLYITNNYFAFYSNVFGFVTKLLIPIASVLKISKEKTARIIPNAVGVATLDEKHVFGSFMSRDSAHRLMLQVWRAARPASNGDDNSLDAVRDIQPGDLECSECSADEYSSGSGSGTESPPGVIAVPVSTVATPSTGSMTSLTCRGRALKGAAPAIPTSAAQQINSNSGTASVTSLTTGDKEKGKKTTTLLTVLDSIPRHTLLLVLSTALLVLLFLSAGLLLYRIGQLHDRSPLKGLESVSNSDDVYGEVLRWQAELRSQSANEVHNMLATHLDQIIKVRRSLESLSMLLSTDEATRTKHGES